MSLCIITSEKPKGAFNKDNFPLRLPVTPKYGKCNARLVKFAKFRRVYARPNGYRNKLGR